MRDYEVMHTSIENVCSYSRLDMVHERNEDIAKELSIAPEPVGQSTAECFWPVSQRHVNQSRLENAEIFFHLLRHRTGRRDMDLLNQNWWHLAVA